MVSCWTHSWEYLLQLPPIGDLRYAAPKLPEPWLTPLDTINYRKGCAQPPGNQLQYGEDCLYLNIFVPYHENVATDPLPVLVWIHGGCWMGGQADVDAGIIAQQDMIVVAVSYRLGSFGFLTTRDSVATGNWGLLDNVMALQWIQNNIANFGGDPTRVTLGGQSSGGVSATLLMFAPSAAGLFHGVLSQSGNAMASWAIHRPPFDPLNITHEFAESLGCPTTTSQIIVDCLRSKPWTEIVDGTATAYDDWCLWTPNIDGVLILEDPTDLLWRGEFSQVPMIIGSTGSEFAYVPTTMTKVDFDAEVREIAQNQYGYAGNVDEATDALIYEFTEPTNAFDEKEIRDEWVQELLIVVTCLIPGALRLWDRIVPVRGSANGTLGQLNPPGVI
uniref:Carboxylic ester hydrolase n=1 Tax=Saccoglossus kowalevskii TaxID=10224 RepID=A0ABM0M213_SACKO|nr:PREDICTED: carboxylesterase 4A-like [Saccoglossus kowalevskii]